MGLSVVVPVYNEKNGIAPTVEQVVSILKGVVEPTELVLVNDGSSDGTEDLLPNLATKYSTEQVPVRVVNHAKNRGYGASLKSGITAAANDTICITDADATYPNDRIPSLLEIYRSGYEMVVGQRSFKRLPRLTKPAKWFLNKLANFLVGRRIPDINSGLRIFDRELAKQFFPMISDGFSFTTTITLAMLSSGYQVRYEPIEYMHREGKSKIKPVRDTLNFIQLIIRTVLYFNPLKIFLPLSFSIVVLAVLLYIIGKAGYLFAEPPVDIAMVLVIGAVQILATGMLADLIVKRRSL